MILHQQCEANGANGGVAHCGQHKASIAGGQEKRDDYKNKAKTADTETEELGKQTSKALVGKRDNDIGRWFNNKKPCVYQPEQKQQPRQDGKGDRGGYDLWIFSHLMRHPAAASPELNGSCFATTAETADLRTVRGRRARR